MMAIREIKQQLATRGDGTFWIDGWRERFGSLAGSPREFVESRPDVFELTWITDKKFTTALVQRGNGVMGAKPWVATSGKVAATGKVATKGQSKGQSKGSEEDVVAEIVEQLRDPSNTEGKFWIQGWHARFRHLGKTAREILEANPELFLINEGECNKFTVTLLGDGVALGGGAGGNNKRKAAGGQAGPPAKQARKDGPGTEKEAIKEIVEQLNDESNVE